MARMTSWAKQLTIPVLACMFCLTNGCRLKQDTKGGGACCGSCAGQPAAVPNLDQKPQHSAANADLPALSAKETSELKNEWTDPATGAQLTFDVQFTQYLPAAAEQAEQSKPAGVPFIITGILTETRKVQGKPVQRQITGDKVRICIMDKNGNIVLNTITPLVKLCAVCGGGYTGEVAKEGEYTAVVWVTNSMVGGTIGQKVTAILKLGDR
jgi:hypothetical protein